MPKLWHETIQAHHRAVHDATLDAAAALVTTHGLLSVTMSQIATETGIGRATLYKYFPDVEAILSAWHHRQIAAHLNQLAEVRDRAGDPGTRLDEVLRAYALISHETRRRHGIHGAELTAFLHRDGQTELPQKQLHSMIRDLLAEGVAAGAVRDDVAATELADYCLHALAAAGDLSSNAAVERLVKVVVAGLRPEAGAAR